jgi:hypothetical protein
MISKQKKIVEKPKKSAPKKNVNKIKNVNKVKNVKNVNVDKIVKIIKKFITKCDVKNIKKGGGGVITNMFNTFRGKNNNTTSNDDESNSICYANLTDIDKIFESIKQDIIEAKKILNDSLQLLKANVESTNTTLIEEIDVLLINYNVKLQSKKIYNYSRIEHFSSDLINNIIEKNINILINISALNIANTLYKYRDMMKKCTDNQFSKIDENDAKKISYNEYIKSSEKNFTE